MRNIVLAGFMGTGKTAVARELARLGGFQRIEIDKEIEKTSGMSIPVIFETLGESAFRDMESREIKRAAARQGVVISTGGGAVVREENMAALKQSGVVVCLSATVETILARTSGSDRPLLQVEDPMAKINELLAIRAPYYARADLTLNTDDKSPQQIAQEILDTLNKVTA